MSMECSAHFLRITETTLLRDDLDAVIRFNQAMSGGIHPHLFQ